MLSIRNDENRMRQIYVKSLERIDIEKWKKFTQLEKMNEAFISSAWIKFMSNSLNRYVARIER